VSAGEPSPAGRVGTVTAVVPAKDEAERIGATLAALARVPEVGRVVVVDVRSRARPPAVAPAAALATGAPWAAGLDPAAPLLLVDADLEDSAANLGPLCRPVLDGTADMTIAVLPPQERPGGGFGFVVRLARRGIERLTGWTPTQPLSGMRCLSRAAFDAAQPLARGWGVEVSLTVDVLRSGGRVVEVPCPLHHRVTGRDWRGQLHRARQYRDVWWALARRGAFRPGRRRAAPTRPAPRR
jgi:hypothetical protein